MLHAAAGLYAALSGPGGLYYSPESGVGMARSRADAANTYDQLLHPFDGWTFGAYAHEVGQFGIGEAKGAVNFVAGTAVSLSPELTLLDEQTGGRLSAPIATTGTQAAGSEFIQPVLFVATFFVDPEEVLALGGKGAKMLGRLKRDGCFIAGTPVQMADGTTEPIERVKAGDRVKSRNPATGQVEARRVLQTTVRQTGQVLALALVDSKTGHQEQITTTDEHPFYVAGKGFVQAGDLGIGTSIVTRAGPTLTLSHVTWAQSGPASGGIWLGGGQSNTQAAEYTVYNLIVEGSHTYFVGTVNGGAWVHNLDCPYPVYFQHQLDRADWGVPDSTHFRRAGRALLQAFDEDVALQDKLATVSGKTVAELRELIDASAKAGQSPVSIGGQRVGFTWQHATAAQAGGRPGVMQLVKYSRHRKLFRFYHPTGRGGYEEWARPNGAPAR